MIPLQISSHGGPKIAELGKTKPPGPLEAPRQIDWVPMDKFARRWDFEFGTNEGIKDMEICKF